MVSSASASVALPAAQVDVSMPAVTGQIIHVNAGGDLQAAIDGARPGDEIVLQAGAVFTGSYTLPNKTGAGWITIVSSGALPAEGVRATAADAGQMATLMAPGGNAPALQTAPGAHNYRLVGLNITAAPSVSQMTSLVNLGDGSSAQNTLAAQPHDIVIDRSYIHGSASLDLRRGVALNSASSAVVNSTISDIHSAASDAQAICGWNGTGPYLIENNDLEASGENVMFGGADPSIPNALPSDITIRGNTFYKPSSWKGVWEVKNLLELKLGQRVLVESNVFNNVWADAQTGFAINVKSVNQDGSAPWANTSNVTIRNNLIENAVSGVSVAAAPDPNPARPTSNVAITGNTFAHIGGGAGAPDGTLFQILGSGGAIDNLTIADNKALTGVDGLATTVSFDGAPTTHFVFTGNRLMEGAYGVKGSDVGVGQATLNTYAPGAVFTGNTLIGADPANYGKFAARNVLGGRRQGRGRSERN
jgi:hypothetical protein